MRKSEATRAGRLAGRLAQFNLKLESTAAISHEGALGRAQLLDPREDPLELLRPRRRAGLLTGTTARRRERRAT